MTPPDLELRGTRFRPLAADELTPPQRAMVEEVLAGPRASLDGPFNVLLRSPQLGNLAQRLGEEVRFRTALPARLRELAILLTARWWASQFEWHAHAPLALAAGVDGAVIDAIRVGARPHAMPADEAIVFEFSAELRDGRRVSDATFAAAIQLLGEQGVVDLIAVMGYYDLVAMALNVDRYPLPPGVASPFDEPVP